MFEIEWKKKVINVTEKNRTKFGIDWSFRRRGHS